MTPKEAIELIEYELPFTSGIIEKALNTIRNRVDKRTPKKPIWRDDRGGFMCICCPDCKDVLATKDKYAYARQYKYCPFCGQALDWSVEDDG